MVDVQSIKVSVEGSQRREVEAEMEKQGNGRVTTSDRPFQPVLRSLERLRWLGSRL